MLRRVGGLLAAAVVCLVVAGCSGEDAAAPQEGGGSTAAAAAAPAKVLAWGEPTQIAGEKGQPLTVTPTGVFFYRGKPEDPMMPAERWFAAVAIRVEAVKGADRMPPGATGEWRIRQGTRMFDSASGNANSAPWVGRVNSGVTPVAPGSPEVAIRTFDVPKGGGELQWVTTGGAPIRWSLPGRTTGGGLDEVKAVMRAG
ncbi:hypothetical protein ACQP25_44340 (plasmid) [Microtetraspora malaysiensis]|uniref:hypothetical protein n=1 Tax=Microtetraspora malaysiensis TaxID=161358 RepID=UPI003D8FCEB0